MLIYVFFFYLLSSASSNHCIASTQILSDWWIRITTLVQYNRFQSFKLLHMFVMCKNPSMRHSYSRCKIFADEMQQKFWPWDWEVLLICTCWMRSSHLLELLIFNYRTPNVIHFRALSKYFAIRYFITIGQLLLCVFDYFYCCYRIYGFISWLVCFNAQVIYSDNLKHILNVFCLKRQRYDFLGVFIKDKT